MTLIRLQSRAHQDALLAGPEEEGEIATTSLEFESHLEFPCGSLSTELSDFCQSAQSEKEYECKQTLKKKVPRVVTSIVVSSTAFNQHLASTSLMQIFKFQRRSCKLSYLFLPHCQSAPESLLTSYTMLHRRLTK